MLVRALCGEGPQAQGGAAGRRPTRSLSHRAAPGLLGTALPPRPGLRTARVQAEPGSGAPIPFCPQGLVGQSPWLQEQLLQLLASHGDTATATHYALDLFLPEGRLPATVAAELSCLRLQER